METKDNGTKTKATGFGCCNPENFKEMFEKMSKCCPGQDNSFDFSAMKGVMTKNMMERCCGSTVAETKRNGDSPNK